MKPAARAAQTHQCDVSRLELVCFPPKQCNWQVDLHRLDVVLFPEHALPGSLYSLLPLLSFLCHAGQPTTRTIALSIASASTALAQTAGNAVRNGAVQAASTAAAVASALAAAGVAVLSGDATAIATAIASANAAASGVRTGYCSGIHNFLHAVRVSHRKWGPTDASPCMQQVLLHPLEPLPMYSQAWCWTAARIALHAADLPAYSAHSFCMLRKATPHCHAFLTVHSGSSCWSSMLQGAANAQASASARSGACSATAVAQASAFTATQTANCAARSIGAASAPGAVCCLDGGFGFGFGRASSATKHAACMSCTPFVHATVWLLCVLHVEGWLC